MAPPFLRPSGNQRGEPGLQKALMQDAVEIRRVEQTSMSACNVGCEGMLLGHFLLHSEVSCENTFCHLRSGCTGI